MRKARFFSVCVFFVLSGVFLSAQETDISKKQSEDTELLQNNNQSNESAHEAGFYFKDYFPVARMHNHSMNFLGAGLSYDYYSPIVIPVPKSLGNGLTLGFSGKIDFAGSFANIDYVKSWWTVNLFGGVFLQWNVNETLEILPAVEYGIMIDNVKSERKANGAYVNQAVQLSPVFKFKPSFIKNTGLSFTVSPFYSMSFEPDGIAHYLGVRFGVMYRFGSSDVSSSSEKEIEYVEVEKIVEKEIVKEIPVEKIVEKEIVKEIPVEKIVEKEVIKEVPVEKIIEKEVIKEVPVEVIKYIEKKQEEQSSINEETETVLETEEISKSEETLSAEETESSEETEVAESIEEEPEVSEQTDSVKEESAPVTEEFENEAEAVDEQENEESEEQMIPEVVTAVEINLNDDGSVAINIPNLLFVSNKAELTDAESNYDTLQKLYEILSDPVYKKFKCVITGYVNPDNIEWTQEEKNLAYERAETVSLKLIDFGLDPETFIIQYGSGKTENKEYNRRVEFKLIK